MGDEGCPKFGVLAFADEADGGQRGLFLMRRPSFADVADQRPHEVGPLVARELNPGNGGNDLCGSRSSLGIAGAKCLQGEVLDARLRLLVGLLEPFCLEGSLVGKLSSGECVLEGETCRGSDVALGVLVCQLLD